MNVPTSQMHPAGHEARDADILTLLSPDADADAAFGLACSRLRAYDATLPGLGRTLAAGYHTAASTTESAPVFRTADAVWTAIALIATGQPAPAADLIAALVRSQSSAGEIPGSGSNDGSLSFGSPEATPLFLLLVAHHFAWSGDIVFTSSIWEQVRKACAFCSDTGLVPTGLASEPASAAVPLEPVNFAAAGIWTAALRELAITAQSLGEAAFASELTARHRRARNQIDRATQRARTATPAHQLSALAAVPLLLGEADPALATAWLDRVAAAEFQTDAGVRVRPGTEALLAAADVSDGLVRPLCTGWIAWAEFQAGRAPSAFRHWRQTLVIGLAGGRWPEFVSHPETGYADHSASTAMAVAPLVYGLLGVAPDAVRGRIRLRPQPPDSWDAFEVRSIRMAENAISFRFRRERNRLIFGVEQVAGPVPLRLVLEPALVAPLRNATVDGSPANLEARPWAGGYSAAVQLVLDAERTLELEVDST